MDYNIRLDQEEAARFWTDDEEHQSAFLAGVRWVKVNEDPIYTYWDLNSRLISLIKESISTETDFHDLEITDCNGCEYYIKRYVSEYEWLEGIIEGTENETENIEFDDLPIQALIDILNEILNKENYNKP